MLSHLEGIPHVCFVTTPTFSPAMYGLTLLTSRQLHYTTNIPEEYIQAKFPESMRKSLLAQVPTIIRKNVDKTNNAKDTCIIHCHEFQGFLLAPAAFNLFREVAMHTLHKQLTAVEHKHQNQTAISLDNLSQATQALLQAMDSMQPSTPWHTYERQNTMVFTPTEVDYNLLRLQAQQYAILLQDLISINNSIKFSITPPLP